MKQCSKCKKLKENTEFYKDKSQISGLETRCKACKKEYYHDHRQERKIYYRQNKERIKLKNAMNSDVKREYDKIYRKKNKETRCENAKIYNLTHKEARNIHRRNRLRTDKDYRMISCLRTKLSLSSLLKLKEDNDTIVKLIGCSINDLKKHLEKQFKKGMAWNNYGKKYGQWQMDHIIPCCAFDLTKESEQIKCFNYMNLQPLWTRENELKARSIKKEKGDEKK